VFLGIALATKFLPAIWLLLFGSTLLVSSFLCNQRFSRIESFKAWAVWLATAAIIVFMVMPNFWVMRGFQNENYAFNSFVSPFSTDAQRIILDTHFEDTKESPIWFYLLTILARMQPFVFILLLGAVVLLGRVGLARWRGSAGAFAMERLLVPFFLLIYAIGFIVVISWVAKKSDRYALPGMVALLPLSAWAAVLTWSFFKDRFLLIFDIRTTRFLLSALAAAVMVQPLFWWPYAIAYDNQVLAKRPLHQQGWGEGLDAAAAYLNALPRADELYIASWYPSVMAHYFKGKVLSLSSRDDHRVAFVVLYRNMGDRGGEAADILAEYQGREPVHTVYIHGIAYAWIYDTGSLYYFDRHVGEVVGGAEVGQIIPVTFNNWDHIDIGISTFSGRSNTHDVTLQIRDGVTAGSNVREVIINASELHDRQWQRFSFEPIADSKGKTYYVAIVSPRSLPGNAITIHYAQADMRPGEMVWRRRLLKEGESNENFIRSGWDLAYRL
jgi:hypothetical protein